MTLLFAAIAMVSGPLVQTPETKVLYAPTRKLADQKISLRDWGSGIITESTETSYEGSNSIRITTRNFFQGGSMVFGEPIDLSSYSSDKNNMLRLTFQSLDGAMGSSPGGKGGFGAPGGDGEGKGGGRPGGFGGGVPGGVGAGGGRPGGAGGPGGFGGGAPGAAGAGAGQGRPGGPGGFGGGAPGAAGAGAGQGRPGGFGGPGGFGAGAPGGLGGGSATPKTLKNIRLIITTTDGKKSEAYLPAATSTASERGWRQAGIPLQAIRGFDKTNKVVREVSFAGDAPSAFYVGDVRILNDGTPLRAEPNVRSLNLALNDSYTFIASGTGGSSILKYSWDFDSADGIQVDAEGQSVTYKFRKASWSAANPKGEFIVTLTVTDEYGLKQPYSTTLKVRVNP